MASDDPRWLAVPPPGAVHIEIAIHADAQLTPELRAAIDRLARALEQDEVEGYAKPNPPPKPCPQLVNCNPKSNCQPLTSYPGCFQYVNCRIGDPSDFPD